MTDDIVERLRAPGPHYAGRLEAADEIERLRARLQPITDAWTAAASDPRRQHLGHSDGTTSQLPGHYQDLLRNHWPTLAAALDNATKRQQ